MRASRTPSSAESASSAVVSSASGVSQTVTSSATVDERIDVVAQDARGEALVGDDQPRRRCPSRSHVYVSRDVLDRAGLALERDEVADAQRLGDREHKPGDRRSRASGGRRSR